MKKITSKFLKTAVLLSLLTIGTENFCFGQSNDDEEQSGLEAIEALKSLDPVKTLQLFVQYANEECPFEADEGMVCKKIVVEEKNVLYYIECDESLESLSVLFESSNVVKDLIKEVFIEEFKNNEDPDIAMMIDLCKSANHGIGYCFVGNKSHKKLKIVVPAKDL